MIIKNIKITKTFVFSVIILAGIFIAIEIVFLYFKIFRETYAYIIYPIILILFIAKGVLKNPVSKLGRLVRAKKYQEAIALSKTINMDKLKSDFAKTLFKINLVAAYYFLNQREEAKNILLSIDKKQKISKDIENIIKEWEDKLLT